MKPELDGLSEALSYLAVAGTKAAESLVSINLAENAFADSLYEKNVFPVSEAQVLIEAISKLRNRLIELRDSAAAR